MELGFQGLGSRRVVSRFDGGFITSDGGVLQLREVEARTGIIAGFAACFEDGRDSARIEHSILEQVSQRVYGLALGYDDLNDHDRLRCDPMLALAVGKGDITGNDRVRERDRGNALAGKSSLNRLELSSEKSDRYRRTPVVIDAVRKFFVESFIRITELEGVPKRLFLDVDATDDPLHGDQEGYWYPSPAVTPGPGSSPGFIPTFRHYR